VTEMKEKNEKEGKSTEKNTKHPASEDYWERKIRKYGDLKDKKLRTRSTHRDPRASEAGGQHHSFTHWYHFGVVTSKAKICAAKRPERGTLAAANEKRLQKASWVHLPPKLSRSNNIQHLANHLPWSLGHRPIRPRRSLPARLALYRPQRLQHAQLALLKNGLWPPCRTASLLHGNMAA
jgi:hypothetical protein